MTSSKTFVIGSIFIGLSVFLGLGLVGYGNEPMSELLIISGIKEDLAYQLSKLIFGICSVIAVFLTTKGYVDLNDNN